MRPGARRTPAFVIGVGLAALTAGATLGAQQPAADKAAPKPPAAPAATAPATTKPAPAAAATAAAVAGELNVTVRYKGKGVVDKAHEITVFLFDTPDIGGETTPIDHQVVEKNGAVARFTGLTVPTAYVAVVYDEASNYEPGQRPAMGTPVAIHGSTGPGVPGTGVKPGKGAKVTVTFDDSWRMQ